MLTLTYLNEAIGFTPASFSVIGGTEIQFSVLIQKQGRGQICYGSDLITLETGDTAVIQGNPPVQFRQLASPSNAMLMSLSTVNPSPAGVTRPDVPIFKIEGLVAFGFLIFNFMTHAAAALPSADQRTIDRLLQAFDRLVRAAIGTLAPSNPAGRARSPDIFEAAASFIDSRLDDSGLGIETVAKGLSITQRSLQKAFRDRGTTLNEWVWSRRLKCARERLHDPLFHGQTIRQIAFASGFIDVTHFSRRFRLAFGVSPRDYRAKEKSGKVEELCK